MKKDMEIGLLFYDEDFRYRVRHLDEETLAPLINAPVDAVKIKVFTNTLDTVYFVVPYSENMDVSYLSGIQAGEAGSVCTTLSSYGRRGGCHCYAT